MGVLHPIGDAAGYLILKFSHCRFIPAVP